jgi:hypothetical protein
MSKMSKTNLIILITSQEVVKHSFSEDKNFQTTKIKGTLIFAAQEKWIRPVLGQNLYIELQNQLNNNSITNLNQVLLNDYVKPCLAYYVKYLALPSLSNPVTNKGPQTLFSEFSKPTTKETSNGLRGTSKTIADALADAMTRFIELNKKDFELYLEENNVRNRIGIAGGVIVRRGSRSKRKKETIYTNVPLGVEALPNYYIFTQITSATEWAFSYKDKIKNEGVQIARVLDSSGNDITDFANILVNSDNETVLITFSEGAFLNENDKSGTVELITATAAAAANLVRGYIEIGETIASFELTEGEVSGETYKWYINENLTNETSDSLDISMLDGEGYLRCEVWQGGTKLLSVFERYAFALTDDDLEVIMDDDNEVLV